MGEPSLRLGGVPEHFNLPWRLAIESPSLSDLALSWEDQYGGTGEMTAKLADGSLDLVSILTEGTVAAIDRGLPVTILQVYVASPLQWGVFVPAASPITSVEELAGSRIAVSRFGSGSHLMAYIQAQAHGWTIDPEQFVVVGGLDGAVRGFAEGSADLFLWDQYMTRPLVDSGAFRQIGVQETPWPSFVIAVRNEALQARTTEVGRVVDEVVTQAVGLHDRPGIADDIAARYGLRSETVRSWLGSTQFQPRSALDASMIGSVRAALAGAGLGAGSEQ